MARLWSVRIGWFSRIWLSFHLNRTSRYRRILTLSGILYPRDPHLGGLWEATIKLANHHLIRLIGSQSLWLGQFFTLAVRLKVYLNTVARWPRQTVCLEDSFLPRRKLPFPIFQVIDWSTKSSGGAVATSIWRHYSSATNSENDSTTCRWETLSWWRGQPLDPDGPNCPPTSGQELSH